MDGRLTPVISHSSRSTRRWPGLNVPAGFTSDGLPIGVQLLAPALDEATLLRVADAYQRRTPHHLARPPEPA